MQTNNHPDNHPDNHENIQEQVDVEILKSKHKNQTPEWFDRISLQRLSLKEESNKHVIERFRLRSELIATHTIEQIQQIIFERYNIDDRQKYHIEWLHVLRYVRYRLLNLEFPPTLSSYWEQDPTFFERLLIRIKCLENGWSQDKIEECIQRYYDIQVIDEKISNYYFCLSKYLDIDMKSIKLKIGRPSIPAEVKSFIKKCINKKQIEDIKDIKQNIRTLKSTFTMFDVLQIQDIIKSSNNEQKDELEQKMEIIKEMIS